MRRTTAVAGVVTADRVGRPPLAAQQARLDDFVACCKEEGPHQVLNMKPAEPCQPSETPYIVASRSSSRITITRCGAFCVGYLYFLFSQFSI